MNRLRSSRRCPSSPYSPLCRDNRYRRTFRRMSVRRRHPNRTRRKSTVQYRPARPGSNKPETSCNCRARRHSRYKRTFPLRHRSHCYYTVRTCFVSTVRRCRTRYSACTGSGRRCHSSVRFAAARAAAERCRGRTTQRGGATFGGAAAGRAGCAALRHAEVAITDVGSVTVGSRRAS